MQKIQLSELAEILNPPPVGSSKNIDATPSDGEPFFWITHKDIGGGFGHLRVTETTKSVLLKQSDVDALKSRDCVLRPFDILVSVEHPKIQIGIAVDIPANCFAGRGFTLIRTKDHHKRTETSFNVFSFLISKTCKQMFDSLTNYNIRTNRRKLLRSLLIPILEGDDRQILVDNIEKEILYISEIEKTKSEIDRLRKTNDNLLFE